MTITIRHRTSWLSLLLLGLSITALAMSSTPQEEAIDAFSPGATMTSAELTLAKEILSLTNSERRDFGLAALTWHNGASQTAFEHSVDMKERDFFDHTNPDGDGPGERLREDNVQWSAYGENIAYGHPTTTTVMKGWMDSPGHRANILNANLTHLGVGVHLPRIRQARRGERGAHSSRPAEGLGS